ncbi:MAG: zinc ABC transporter substrate-binding protein [Hydrotalea sp.]|nr:zinc ABC transporter substrate-binding protein [Hydrotalea sp.]
MKKIFFLIILLAQFISPAVAQTSDKKLQVVASLYPVYDFTKEIGGDKIAVRLLLPPGVEAHHFDPTPTDVLSINRADVFTYVSDTMEPWAKKILASLNNGKLTQLTIVNSGRDVASVGNDPHLWLDLSRAQQMVTAIADGLATADPSNKKFYRDRAKNYNRQLALLDNDYKKTIATCQQRDIIYGGHNTFGYLARRYGLTTSAVTGFSDDAEPTAKGLKNIIDNVKKNNIHYIFYEELSDPKIAVSLARETGAKLLLLNGAHEVSKDDMVAGVSFLTIMKNNLNNLALGLSCRRA